MLKTPEGICPSCRMRLDNPQHASRHAKYAKLHRRLARAYQLRNAQKGRCQICGRPAITKTQCELHCNYTGKYNTKYHKLEECRG